MNTFFQRTVNRLGHLSDDTFTKLINGELSSYREFRANAHLGKCWQCNARREALEKASFQVVEYRKYQLARRLPLDPRRRQTFLTRLDEVWDAEAANPWRLRFFSRLRSVSMQIMNPVYASAFVVAIAVVLLILIWRWTPVPMSGATFLEKAVLAEAQRTPQNANGVAYQKVAVHAGGKILEHAVYRDLTHKRKPRPVALQADEKAVRAELVSGGVDWQQPLSALDYRQWHDGQHALLDEVRSSGNELLTLTTTVASGPIAAESLTVRLADFHPVRRTVSVRGAETIEIAELHFDVLGWDAVNEALFEPLGGATSSAAILPHLPSAGQLDLAELQARLVLSGLHADSTEQLEFLRSPTSVEVKGIVDSEARKQTLVSALRTVPHIVPAIFSVADLAAHKSVADNVTSVTAYSAVADPSPLELYLNANGAHSDDLSLISQQLLDAALSIKQEGTAIDELQRRFGKETQLTEVSRQTLVKLLDAHAKRLKEATEAEDLVLLRAVGTLPVPDAAPVAEPLLLSTTVPLNLCKELISSQSGTQHDVQALAADLLRSTQAVRASLRNSMNSMSSLFSGHSEPARTEIK